MMNAERLAELRTLADRSKAVHFEKQAGVCLGEALDEVEAQQLETGKWATAFEDCNQKLLSHVQQEHPHEYEEMVEVLKREDLLKVKVQSLEAALDLTGNAMNVLGIKEKDAEIERLRKGLQEYGIHKMGCHGHVGGPCDCGLEQVERKVCPECGGRREILDDMGGTWACPACNLIKPEESDATQTENP